LDIEPGCIDIEPRGIDIGDIDIDVDVQPGYEEENK
jgi:hypothetical protein